MLEAQESALLLVQSRKYSGIVLSACAEQVSHGAESCEPAFFASQPEIIFLKNPPSLGS